MFDKRQKGFTLLEILIAMTLSSLVLGSLFVLQSNSSRLAFRADQKIDENISLRAALNTALLMTDKQNFIAETLNDGSYHIANISLLEQPETQSDMIKWRLEKFDIIDNQANTLISSIRFKKITQ